MKRNFIILIIVTAVLVSCSTKREDEKLTGTWNVVFLTAGEQTKTVYWTFSDGNTLTTTDYRTDTTIIDTGSYFMTKEFPATFFVDITSLDYNSQGLDLNGRWQIIKLNKKFLTLERVLMPSGSRPGAYLWKEFTKSKN